MRLPRYPLRLLFRSLPGVFLLICPPEARTQKSSQTRPTTQEAAQILAAQPLHFEALARTSGSPDHVAAGPGYGVRLSADQVAVTLLRGASTRRTPSSPDALQFTMTLAGADPAAAAEELEPLLSTSSYFLGSDPAAWRSGVPQFARLRYRSVYPGIDVLYYGNGAALEHDFVIQPHANPAQLRFRFDGVTARVEPSGDLLLSSEAGVLAEEGLHLLRPVAFQPATARASRREVDARFDLLADGSVRFVLGGYDPARVLVIDPTLAYATYFGSSNTVINGIALDASGNIFIAGVAPNYGFSKKNAPFSGGNATFSAFLAKLDPTGANVLFAGFIGGSTQDEGLTLALDSSGNAYIAGLTQSANFPTLHAAQASYGVSSCYSSFVKCFNGFVTGVKSDGSALLYSTYLGGSVDDRAEGIAVDSTGAAYITGYTKSGNFPTLHAYQSTLNTSCNNPSTGSCQDAFVTKLDATGALVFSTYLGGTATDDGHAIALDAAKNIYITGQAGGGNFPNTSTLVNNGSHITSTSGAFITEMAADGQALVFSDVVGFNSGFGTALAVDTTGIYMTGANSGNLPTVPTTAGTYSSTQSGVYALKLKLDGSAFLYSTYVGGILNDQANAIAVDASGDAFLAGFTGSATFPTTGNALQPTSAGGFLHSSDGGATFTGASSGLGNCSPVFLSIDPAHSGNVLTGCSTALYLSTNSAASWTQVATTGLPATIVTGFRTASSSTTLYILGTTGMYKSTDNGITWTRGAGTGLPALSGTTQELVGDPANASVVYFSQASVGQPFVFRSADGGNTWTSLSIGLPTTGNLNILVSDNTNAGTLYAAIGTKVYKTINSGALWTLPNATGVSYAIRGLSLDPANSSTLYVGTSLGYFKSTDGGSTFIAGNSSLFNATTIAVDPANSNNLYASILDAGYYAIKKSSDGGTTFTATPFVNAPPNFVVIDPASHTNVYVGSSPTPTAFLTELDPTGASLLYSSYYGGIGWTEFNALTLDPFGNPIAAGMSNSTTNTTTNSGAQPSFAGTQASLTPADTTLHPDCGCGLGLTSSGSTGTGPYTGIIDQVILATSAIPDEADLAVSITAAPIYTTGSRAAAIVTVKNLGATRSPGNPAPASSVVVMITAGQGLSLDLFFAPGSQCSVSSKRTQVVCTLDSPLAVGQTLTFRGGVSSTRPTPGAVNITVSAVTSSNDPALSNNTATAAANITQAVDDLTVYGSGAQIPNPMGYSYFKIVFGSHQYGPQYIDTATYTLTLGSGNFAINSVRGCGQVAISAGTMTCEGIVGMDIVEATISADSAATASSWTASVFDDTDRTVDLDPGNNFVSGTLTVYTSKQTATILSPSGLTQVNASATPFLIHPNAGTPPPGTAFAADPLGNFWVAGPSGLSEYTSAGSFLSTFTGGGLSTITSSPTAEAIDSSGAIWIANSNNTLSVFDNSGTALSPSTGYTGLGLSAPTGIAVDASGSVWVTNSGSGTVTRYFGAASPTATPLSTNVANGAPSSTP